MMLSGVKKYIYLFCVGISGVVLLVCDSLPLVVHSRAPIQLFRGKDFLRIHRVQSLLLFMPRATATAAATVAVSIATMGILVQVVAVRYSVATALDMIGMKHCGLLGRLSISCLQFDILGEIGELHFVLYTYTYRNTYTHTVHHTVIQ